MREVRTQNSPKIGVEKEKEKEKNSPTVLTNLHKIPAKNKTVGTLYELIEDLTIQIACKKFVCFRVKAFSNCDRDVGIIYEEVLQVGILFFKFMIAFGR